jgi:uncharacterized protein (TIGR02466 family)
VLVIRDLFVTRLYQAELAEQLPLAELAHAVRHLAAEDRAGRRWAREHGYKGYTSYASLNDLPRRDPTIAAVAKPLLHHAATFAGECGFALPRKLRLDSLWVNLLRGGGGHSGHLHPHSIISGTLYVEVPPGSGAIRFEDPRLPMMMAAPPRRPDAPEPLQSFVTVEPHAGLLLLWESWLRHEVLPGRGNGERLSISFNLA